MKVELLDYTDKPEKTVAMAARNDYSDDWVADVGYEAAMEPIDYDQETTSGSRTTLQSPHGTTPELSSKPRRSHCLNSFWTANTTASSSIRPHLSPSTTSAEA